MILTLISIPRFVAVIYIEDTFNELIDVETEKHLSMLHLNTRSLPGNFDKVTNLLSTLNLNFSMIGISETWLKDAFHSCDIPGYNYIHDPRRSRTGGALEEVLASI